MSQRCYHHRPASEVRIALYDYIIGENKLPYNELMLKASRQDLLEQMSTDVDIMLARLFPKAPKNRPNIQALLYALVIVEFRKEVLLYSAPIQDTLYLAACDVMSVLVQYVNVGTAWWAEPPGDTDDADNEPDPHDMSNDDVIKALDNYADALEAWLVISKDNTLTPFAAEAIGKHLVDHPDVDYWSPAALA